MWWWLLVGPETLSQRAATWRTHDGEGDRPGLAVGHFAARPRRGTTGP